MKRSSLFLALVLVSPLASADIFKCKDAKDNDKYQNFPCPIDSIGSHATASPPKEEPKQETKAEAKQASPVVTPQTLLTPVRVPQSAFPPKRPPANHTDPEPGMSMADVRAAWGEPKTTETTDGDQFWYYDGPWGMTRTVRFNSKGTVLVVTETE